jgi:hypothetical protein
LSLELVIVAAAMAWTFFRLARITAARAAQPSTIDR